jgi:AraC-like DNA-binding protein
VSTASIYQERPMAPRLARWAVCRWVRRAPAGVGPGVAPALVVPDGCVDLLWIDGGLAVAGPDTRPRTAGLGATGLIAGLRLRPGAAALLLGQVPASALLDTRAPLAELWPRAAADRLGEQLAAIPTDRPADGWPADDWPTDDGPTDDGLTDGWPTGGWQAAELLHQAVGGLLPGFAADPAVLYAVSALDRPRPPSVPALAGRLGLSERQLRRRMVAAVGYGPKTLQGVLRFQRVRAATRHGPDVDWAALAAGAGYADQAHLTREVRRWSGRPPTLLVRGD